MKQKLIVGIDADIDKSGVAILSNFKYTDYSFAVHKGYLYFNKLQFVEVFELLSEIYVFCENENITPELFIDAGWLNVTKNYHVAKTKAIAAKIGYNVGQNHQTGKLIVQLAKNLNFRVHEVKPTQKKWNSETFQNIVGIKVRTNSEVRDAVKLIFGRI